MPSYKTLAPILIATSAVGSVLAAPAPAQEMRDARADLSQLDRRLNPDVVAILKTAPVAGLVAGTVAALATYAQKYINSATGHKHGSRTFHQHSVRMPARLSDGDLLLLRHISRRALEDLD